MIVGCFIFIFLTRVELECQKNVVDQEKKAPNKVWLVKPLNFGSLKPLISFGM